MELGVVKHGVADQAFQSGAQKRELRTVALVAGCFVECVFDRDEHENVRLRCVVDGAPELSDRTRYRFVVRHCRLARGPDLKGQGEVHDGARRNWPVVPCPRRFLQREEFAPRDRIDVARQPSYEHVEFAE
ncbi:MAG TPA: hypothetical protein VH054_21075 [Polyangiaceae bacterium]|nr:hypothetical protein [Polyangiaceae bacterium]